jgi:hypothetical protein
VSHDARGRPMPQDVQRDLNFYRTLVALRNAIERMQVAKGTVNPDEVHLWWGFGYLGGPRTGRGGREDRDWDDLDDLAGSRVPRRPYGGAGATGAELAEPVQDEEVVVGSADARQLALSRGRVQASESTGDVKSAMADLVANADPLSSLRPRPRRSQDQGLRQP